MADTGLSKEVKDAIITMTPNEAFLKQWEANNQLYKICMSHPESTPDWIKNLKVEENEDG